VTSVDEWLLTDFILFIICLEVKLAIVIKNHCKPHNNINIYSSQSDSKMAASAMFTQNIPDTISNLKKIFASWNGGDFMRCALKLGGHLRKLYEKGLS